MNRQYRHDPADDSRVDISERDGAVCKTAEKVGEKIADTLENLAEDTAELRKNVRKIILDIVQCFIQLNPRFRFIFILFVCLSAFLIICLFSLSAFRCPSASAVRRGTACTGGAAAVVCA